MMLSFTNCSLRLSSSLVLACLSAYAQPMRIVSTAPSITETLFALGAGKRVVGVTQYCTYPAEARKLPRIGSWVAPNMEAIVSLRPDLVIVQKTAIHSSDKFRALRLKTIEVEFLTVDDIFRSIQAIGDAVGASDSAVKLSAKIRAQIEEVRKRVSGRPAPSVMFVVGRTPGTLEGLIAAGGNSYQSEVIAFAGGRNILSDSSQPYAKVLHEEILARNPDVIFDMGEHADAKSLSEEDKRGEIALWNRFPKIRAVQTKRIYIVSSDLYVHPGPRVGELAAEFARFLHPEAFR